MANRRKSIFAIAIASCLGLGTLAVAPATVAAVPNVRKVALVDMQRVLNETKQGKKARNKLEKSSEAKSKKLESKRKKLESEMAKLEGKSGAELAQMQESLQRDYMELQQMYMQLQQDLAVQENELLEQIYKNSQTIVNGLAKEYGVDLVLIRDESTVLYADKNMDVTGELVKRYDAKYK